MKTILAFLLMSISLFSNAQTKINPARLLQGTSGGGSVFLKSDNSGNVSFSNNLNGGVLSGLGNGTLSSDAVNLGQLTWVNISSKPTLQIQGNGIVVTGTDNWNTFTSAGTYTVSGGAGWAANLNSPGNTFPDAYSYGLLEVDVMNNVTNQKYTTHGTPVLYIRSKFNTSDWTVWRRVLTESVNIPDNYLVRKSSNGTLVQSYIYDNFNVGIGTTTTLGRLTVNTDDNNWNMYQPTTSGAIRMSGWITGISSSSIQAVSSNGSVYKPLSLDAENIRFANSGTEYMRLTGGNVGIGTTGPGFKLDVNGVSRFISTSAIGLVLQNNNATPNYTSMLYGTYGVNNGFTTGFRNTGDATGFYYVTPYGRTEGVDFAISNAGLVGIGTSSPTQKLHVNGNLRFDGYLFGYQGRLIGGSDAGGAYFGGGGGTSSTLPTYIMSDNAAIIFNNNSSERMRISSSGNVGIGIATPNYKLDVTGSVYSTQGFFTSSSSIGIQGDGTSLYLKSSGSTYLNTANNASISSSGVLTSTGITINGSGTIAGTLSINAATAANHAVTLSQLQDASNLTTGTIPDARLSSNIARVDLSTNLQTAGAFSGGNSFSNLNSSIENYIISSYNSANSSNNHSIYLADLPTNVNSKTINIINIGNTSVATGAVIRIYPPTNYQMSLTKDATFYELVLDAANTATSDNFTGTNKWKVECTVIRSGSRCNCFLVKN